MKKFFAFVLAMVMVATLFAGCGTTSTESQEPTDTYIALFDIPGYTNLVYMSETGTVYYQLSNGGGYSWMVPYIINGHFCEYVDGEIVEVIPTVRIEDAAN